MTHCRAQRRQNGLGLIPLVHRFRSSDELVEWYEERPHALNALKLVTVSELSAQFGPSPWRNFLLMHHIVKQLHCLIELFLCNEQFLLQCVEDNANEQMIGLFGLLSTFVRSFGGEDIWTRK